MDSTCTTQQPCLTPSKVAADSQQSSSSLQSSGFLEGVVWYKRLVEQAIAKLENKKGFDSSRTRRVTNALRKVIAADLNRDVRWCLLLSCLNPPPELPPQDVACLYNDLIETSLKESRDLRERQDRITLLQGQLKIAAWEICANPMCGKLFESARKSGGLCSPECRRSVRNRNDYLRRGDTHCGTKKEAGH